jgi:hypothetical protein
MRTATSALAWSTWKDAFLTFLRKAFSSLWTENCQIAPETPLQQTSRKNNGILVLSL